MEQETQPMQVGDAKSPSPRITVSSSISETSTIAYEQESFETFQHKVADVVAKHFHCDISQIKVTYLKGGAYNRVAAVSIAQRPKRLGLSWLIGVVAQCLGTRRKTRPLGIDSYIVPVPRGIGEDEDLDVNFEVAALLAADAYVPLPTPKVVSYDLTSNNAIEKPFMVQKHIPGQNLSMMLEKLNWDQKMCMAKRVAELAPKIATVEGPAGIISIATLSLPSGPLQIEKYRVPKSAAFGDRPLDLSITGPRQVREPIDYLLEYCERWREYHVSRGKDVGFHEF